MRIAYIEGAAGLAMLAAVEAVKKGQHLPPLPTIEKAAPRKKSESLKRMLRKAKR